MWFLMVVDVVLTFMAFLASLTLRFEFSFIGYFFRGIWPLIIIGMIVRPFVLYFAGVYKQVWRYATTRDFFKLGIAIVIGSIIISIAAFLMYPNFIYTLPRSILIIEEVLSIILLGGFRLFIHQIEKYPGDILWKRVKLGPASKVLIVGAGNAGVSIIRELADNPQLGLKPVALIDDDLRKIGRKIHGISVYGPLIKLADIAKNQNIDAVIIAIPSAPQQTIQNIKNMCHSLQLPYSTMPSLSSFLRIDEEAPQMP